MLPTPYTVVVSDYSERHTEAGRLVTEWTPRSQREPVYGWGPPQTSEPKIIGYDRLVVEVELLAPPTFSVKPNDRVRLGGSDYRVIGYAEDYTHGPFGFRPGVVVNLRRFEG
ncbi:hypothetical protein [Nocardia terpenica]|uniref:Head-to-tail stopper n=1 Tax=Nocardia terpenica TaxID=455432 RepID=A0A164HFN3_9NOCA|nr:hypothetical protein [Nocardia terpenica]KZM68473.1 hypothetical protein AWN90_11425 [Nocardia terpenica]NQE88577.1 hypothetical protein [Nocardia terpenica]